MSIRTIARVWGAPLICVIFVALFGAGLLTLSQDRHPLSIVDEHIHFDTAVRATHGEIPWRGALLTDELVQEWACGVGHEAGPLPYPCGDPRLSADVVPSGRYTSGYIHYPTYFFGAAAFQHGWAALTGDSDLLDGYRAFSAATMILGVIACGLMAWMLRLRGVALIAATTLPVAATMIVYNGAIINPTSATVLCGALIAGTGLRWAVRDRGFVWFALATAFSACVGVVHSLPAGGFLIAMIALLAARAFSVRLSGVRWNPRWWHAAVIAAILVAPIIVWGQITSMRATITNAELYGFYTPSGRGQVLVGAIAELASLHTPWRHTANLGAGDLPLPLAALGGLAPAIPTWITILVFGVILIVALPSLRPSRTHHATGLSTTDGRVPAANLVATALVLGIVLYPPALRVSNWITMGFDHPIVDRYSAAFAAALALAALCMKLPRGLLSAFAVLGVLGALATVAPAVA